jgi:hypothetical protein
VSAIAFQVTFDDGETVVDELMPLDVASLEKIEKRFQVLGRRGTIRIVFDPPLLVPPPAVEDGESS